MLLKRNVLDGVLAGKVSLAFRRWRKPTVRAGGTLTTAIGVLAIDSISIVEEAEISEHDAVLADYSSLAELRRDLARQREGQVYRIALRYACEDPRLALRAADTIDEELLGKLKRLDREAPWTQLALTLIGANPGRRAAELARQFGRDTASFKTDVRKLKALGLTESLETGYRLSRRGETLLAHLASRT